MSEIVNDKPNNSGGENITEQNDKGLYTKEQVKLIVKDQLDKKDVEISAIKEQIETEKAKPNIYKVFKKQGGQKAAFEDFYKMNQKALTTKDADISEVIGTLKKEKEYFFGSQNIDKKIDIDIKSTLEKDFSKSKTKDADAWQGSSLYKK